MSDSPEHGKFSPGESREDGTNGTEPIIANDSGPAEEAPEGVVPLPTLASLKKPNTIALKKRAPVPSRSPAVAAASTGDAPQTGTLTPAPVDPVLPHEEIVPETPVAVAVAAPETVEAQTGIDVESKVATAPVVEESASTTQVEAISGPTLPTPGTGSGVWATLARLRAGWGWVLGAGAFGVALWGQKIAEADRAIGSPAPPLISWLMFGLAGLLFVIGIAPAPSARAHPTSPFLKGIRTLPIGRRILFLGLLFGGIAVALGAVPLFVSLSAQPDLNQGWLINNGSWMLYVLALAMFGGAWVVWEFKRPETGVTLEKGDDGAATGGRGSIHALYSALIMVGLLVLGLSIRLPGLDNAPPGLWFDEAQNGIVGRDLLAPGGLHPAYITAYTQMGALFFYLYGAVVKLFGESAIWPLRFLPALAGSLIAPMLYMIGYRLFGWRVGVAAGVLVAVSAWNVTMSRFGVASLPTVAVDVAAYLCLVQGLRTGRLGWYAGAGVLLGLALQMYYPAQLVPIVLVLVLAHRLISGRMTFFRAVRAGVVAFALGALIAFIPVATFAIQHTNDFTQRVQTISIFSPEGSEGRPNALQVSIERHVLMFNYRGDANPRHNLPGEPMLDWITAALFLAGVAVCALRAWRWQYFFALVWLLVNMSGGILSVVFEAPQSHRTLENSVVTALIAAIFLGELWAALDTRVAGLTERVKGRIHRSREQVEMTGARAAFGFRPSTLMFGAPALLLLIWIGTLNIDRYFNKQANDMSVWLEMGGTNKLMGLALAKYGGDHTVYVSPDHAGIPTSNYLAPNMGSLVWPGAYILPFTGEQNVALLFGPTDEANVLAIRRIYPNAQVEVGYGPNPNSPQFFAVTITAEDIRSVRGTQRVDETHTAATVKIEQLDTYKFEWLGAAIAPQLMVDGTEVSMGQGIDLALGLHSVVLSGVETSFSGLGMGKGTEPAVPIPNYDIFDPRKVEPRGLTAYLRNGDVFDGPTPIIRIDPQVSFYFHEIPLNRPYTVEWIGKLYAPIAGTYGFQTEQLSRSRLFIDGAEVLYNSTPNSSAATRIDLQVGLHDIHLQYEDLDGASHMYLYWTPPQADPNERFIIPATFLLPQMGSYPDVPASGAWPTIDEADDTVWAHMNQPIGSVSQPPPDQGQGQTDVPVDVPQQQPTPAPPPDAIPASVTITGGSNDTLPRPRAAAVDPDGNIYIYTELDSMIKKFDKSGEQVAKWDAVTADGEPSKEGSALLVREGKLLYLDAGSAEVVTYSLDGREEGRTHICDCFAPRGMALTNDGNLWVTDTGFNKVDKVTIDGTLISSVGEKGTGPGQLVEPSSVWESPDGHLFVTDAGNKRVQSFTPDGKPLAQWPMGEGTARDGNRLTGTSNGNALLTQYDGKAIIEYTPDGTEKARWQYAPQGVALIPAGITQAGNNRYVVLFQFDNVAGVFDIGH